MVRLAVLCTHPVQYVAPVFKELSASGKLELQVFYGWRGTENSIDPGFGRQVAWDVPLLEGYGYEFVENVARDPGSHRYLGIDLPSLCSRISTWRPDAILIYGWCYKSHLAAMRHFKGKIPVFFRGDSTLLDERVGARARLRRWVLRWVYKHVDIALSVGTNNRAYFRAHGLSESQIIHAPHAIDNERFKNCAPAEIQGVRTQLGISDSAIVCLFAGKLERKKAPDLLCESFLSVADSSMHLVIAGSGPLESQLKAKSSSRVHFLGFRNQTQIPAAYHAADVVALPSRGPGETWGLAINEAMACGRAVIASDRVGAAIDLVKPGDNGWVVPANSVEALARALREGRGLGRSGLARLGTRSLQIIRNWTIPLQANAIERAVNSVVVAKG